MERLQQMSIKTSIKYQEYKYKLLRRMCFMLLAGVPLMILCTGVIYIGVIEEYKNLSFVIGGLGSAGLIFCAYIFRKTMNEFKDEPEVPYEYAIVPYKTEEKQIKVEGPDGEIYRFGIASSARTRYLRSGEIVFIRVPWSGHIVLEEREVWDKIES